MSAPTLSPSAKRTPERVSVSIDRRLDVAGAPPVTGTLAPRSGFVPVDTALWVSLDLDGTGRWSAHLWGAGYPQDYAREVAQFDGPVRDGEPVTYSAPPEWVLSELTAMLAEVNAKAALLR